LGVAPIVAAAWKYVVASLLAGVAAAAIIRPIWGLAAASSSLGAFVHLAGTSLLFAALYLAAVVLLHRGPGPLYQLAGLLREMTPWGKSSPPPAPVVVEEPPKVAVLT
jgi:hypothetical protein